ncbi:hypothetical protein [Cellulomonas sp. KRMCY2]|uniref:hypothetical protein n=1 Tax=Cellulomonas sp. KRMCY2 TaxID=1304865 RepID=UPI00045EB994|nr:hypothetical protein [Cellulomonas sp. KRMCY2]
MVLQTLLWMVAPAVVYGLLAAAFIEPDPPRWLARVTRVMRRLKPRRRTTGRTRRGRRTAEPDPFDALDVQVRLGQVAALVRALESDPKVWARGKRMQATQAAYDDLLAEACELAGVEVPPLDRAATRPLDDPERFREELELASRGWSW